MKNIITSLLLVIFTSSLSLADTITIGIENLDYYPYYSTDGTKTSGAAVELLEKFSDSYQHKIQFKALPVARLLPTFLMKDIAYKFPANPNWAKSAKKDADVVYSQPIFQFTDGVLVKVENKGKGVKRLGVVRGFTAWDYLDKIESGEVKITEGSKLASLVKMLDLDRIDGIYCNINVANIIVKKILGNNSSIQFDESLPHTSSNYHLAAHGKTQIINDLNTFLIKESVYIQNLKSQYGIF